MDYELWISWKFEPRSQLFAPSKLRRPRDKTEKRRVRSKLLLTRLFALSPFSPVIRFYAQPQRFVLFYCSVSCVSDASTASTSSRTSSVSYTHLRLCGQRRRARRRGGHRRRRGVRRARTDRRPHSRLCLLYTSACRLAEISVGCVDRHRPHLLLSIGKIYPTVNK